MQTVDTTDISQPSTTQGRPFSAVNHTALPTAFETDLKGAFKRQKIIMNFPGDHFFTHNIKISFKAKPDKMEEALSAISSII